MSNTRVMDSDELAAAKVIERHARLFNVSSDEDVERLIKFNDAIADLLFDARVEEYMSATGVDIEEAGEIVYKRLEETAR